MRYLQNGCSVLHKVIRLSNIFVFGNNKSGFSFKNALVAAYCCLYKDREREKERERNREKEGEKEKEREKERKKKRKRERKRETRHTLDVITMTSLS